MSVYQLKTFADIYNAVCEEVGISASDTTDVNRVKRAVNMVYAEVAGRKRWYWLNRTTDVTLPAYIQAGTASVTQNSAQVTLTVAPTASKTGYWFYVDGYNEIYRIESHTAGSVTVNLANIFTGTTNAAATYKIWTERVPLPTDCKETVEVWHDNFRKPLENIGRQEFRKCWSLQPRNQGYPAFYFTGDYVDPAQTSSITSLPGLSTRASAGTRKTLVFGGSIPAATVTAINNGDPVVWNISYAGHPSYNGNVYISSVSTTNSTNDTVTFTGNSEYTETAVADSSMVIKQLNTADDYDRYRELFLYPSINLSNVTLHVEYTRQFVPLNNDTDEPYIPLHDRDVLYYGALWRTWKRKRNDAETQLSKQEFEEKLAEMESKFQDSTENARLEPSKNYLGAKRNLWRKRYVDGTGEWGGVGYGGGGVAGQQVTGTASKAAQFGADGVLVASGVTTTELGYVSGVTSGIQSQLNAKQSTTLTDAHILVGNNSNKATDVAVSGDLTLADTGAFTVATVGSSTASNIHTAEVAANAATSSNTVSTIVKRDASGNFSAGTITAALTGTASTATAPASGSAHGAVTLNSSGNFQSVAPGAAGHYLRSNGTDYVDSAIQATDLSGITNTQLSGSAAITNANLANMASSSSTVGTVKGNISGSAATPSDITLTAANTASTAVYRDGSGNFSAGTITAALTGTASGNLQATANNHGVLVSGSANTATVVAPDAATTKFLRSGGSSADPTWNQVTLTSDVTGVLPEANGGTHQSTYTTGDTLYASASNTLSKLAVGTSGQFLKVAGGVPSWGPGASGINYLSSNPDAETDTSGWATYNDGASATPVDATGGVATTTWTRTTTSPLRGTGSFLATKDAANRQGEGASFAITLDSADQAKPIMVSFDYSVASGTYADGDLTVYLYDVTNAVVIQPAPFKILSAATGLSQKWIGYFQTSAASTSYRLAIHVASTSASAYTVKFDNFNVGPTYQSYGAVEGDWQSFTPTASWSSHSTWTGWWKRIGDTLSMRAKVAISGGAPDSATLTVNLPSGLTIDTTKLPGTPGNIHPFPGLVTGQAAAHGFVGGVIYNNTTSIQPVDFEDGSTASFQTYSSINQAHPYTFTTGDYVYLEASGIPISGWSSNVQVSSDADTRVCAMFAAAQPTGTLNGSANDAIIGTVVTDTHGAYNATTGVYTVAVPGNYDITGSLRITGTYAAGNTSVCHIVVNGSDIAANVATAGGSNASLNPVATVNGYPLKAGDAVKLQGQSSATGPAYAGSAASYFSIARRSGPAQIAASEKVYLQYTGNGGGAQTAGTTKIDFTTKVTDSHNAWTSSNTFTAPRAGWYDMRGCILHTAAANCGLTVFINGVSKYGSGQASSAVNGSQQPFYLGTYMNQGDTADFRVDTNSTLTNNAIYHWLAITSQG